MRDSQVRKLIAEERKRQKKVINLIASENLVSRDVLEALGSPLTNKYAEGYSGRRYYGGNAIMDKIEDLAKERALKLFGLNKDAWSVNVQPLSGSPANLAVYLACVPGGGKIMAMALNQGGHLTHGHGVSASGKFWKQVAYGVDPITGLLDYDQLRDQAQKEKPSIIVAGYTAYSRIIDWAKMRDVADAGESLLMVDMSHFAGLVAGGEYPPPFAFADIVTTTTHKTLRGPRSALIFARRDGRDLAAKIDKAVFPGLQGGPHMNQIAAVAVCLEEASKPSFKKYASQVVKNAKVLASSLDKYGWRIISGGTDTHLILVDTWTNGHKNDKGAGGITGEQASVRLEKSGIIVNKNAIPFDNRPPADPSGIRLGSAFMTTLGLKEKDFEKIAKEIDEVLRSDNGIV